MGFKFFNPNLIKQFLKSSQFTHYKQLYAVHRHYDNRSSSSSFPYTENPNFKICKRFHGGHSHHHHQDQTSEEGARIFKLGLAADIGLTAGKVFTGYLSGSTAIIADAAHSLSDVVLSGVALLSFKASRIPKDKEHPYGHGKFETLGALGISGVLLVSAGGIAWHASDVLMLAHSHIHQHGIDMNHPILALNMTIVAIAVKEGLYWITKRAGERAGSGLMKANAWHHRVDAISSLVALLGVGGSILGVRFLDPLAGLLVSGMIFKAGLQTGYQSILELVDAAIPSRELDQIRRMVLELKGVEGCRHLRGRRAGSTVYLDVKIQVDPLRTISVAHQIGENVRFQIQNSHPEVSEVFIQLEPAAKHLEPVQEVSKVNFNPNSVSELDDGIEDMVTNMLISKFSEKLTVEHVAKSVSQNKISLQIEFSMPADK